MNLSTPRPIEERTGAPDWDRVRLDFPLLMREVHGKPLVYFDNANTGQKPVQVIGAVDEFYRHPMIFDQTSQIRGISMAVVRCQHHSRTGQKRSEVSPQRDVECRSSLLQIDVFWADGVLILHPQDLVHDGVMRHRNAFGLARGTRGEDHVGGIHIMQTTATISIGND